MGNDLNIVAKGDTFVLRFAFSVYKLLAKPEFTFFFIIALSLFNFFQLFVDNL